MFTLKYTSSLPELQKYLDEQLEEYMQKKALEEEQAFQVKLHYDEEKRWLTEHVYGSPQKLKEICGVGMYSHWFSKSQFGLITEEHYKQLQAYYSGNDAFKKEYDDLKKEYYSTRAFFDNTHDTMRDVWDFGRISHEEKAEAGGHATPKPIILCSRAIKSSSRENETVLDLFGGSGSTLIACEQLNRKCYMMEMSPKYVDVIIKRWEEYTGKKAVKIA